MHSSWPILCEDFAFKSPYYRCSHHYYWKWSDERIVWDPACRSHSALMEPVDCFRIAPRASLELSHSGSSVTGRKSRVAMHGSGLKSHCNSNEVAIPRSSQNPPGLSLNGALKLAKTSNLSGSTSAKSSKAETLTISVTFSLFCLTVALAYQSTLIPQFHSCDCPSVIFGNLSSYFSCSICAS